MNPMIEERELRPALYLNVKWGKPGNSAKLNKAEKDAVLTERTNSGDTYDATLINLTKKLWESPAYDAIVRFDKEQQARLQRYTLPANRVLKEGVYRIGVYEASYWDDLLTSWRREREELVTKFLDVYSGVLEESKRRLGPLWREEQFPTVDKLQQSYRLSWSFIQLVIPEELKQGDPALAAKAQQVLDTLTKETIAECQAALRTAFFAHVTRAAERLKIGEDGKKTRFNDTLLTNMQEYLEFFTARNSTVGDVDLAALVERTKNLLVGVDDADVLRDNMALREQVQREMATIAKQMVESMPEVTEKFTVSL